MSSTSPSRAAIQLLKPWIAVNEEPYPVDCKAVNEEPYPVDCKAIAEGLGIQVIGESLNDDFQGCLYVSDGIKAIIYNDQIKSKGRINYTIAHELGHYCLHRSRGDLKCSLDDLNDMGDIPPHSDNIEREANHFAANLLMPASAVREISKGHLPSVQLAELIANKFETSLLSSIYRLAEISPNPACIVALNSENKVISIWKNNKLFGLFIQRGLVYKEEITTHKTPEYADPDLWSYSNSLQIELMQSSVDYSPYNLKVMILTGEVI